MKKRKRKETIDFLDEQLDKIKTHSKYDDEIKNYRNEKSSGIKTLINFNIAEMLSKIKKDYNETAEKINAIINKLMSYKKIDENKFAELENFSKNSKMIAFEDVINESLGEAETKDETKTKVKKNGLIKSLITGTAKLLASIFHLVFFFILLPYKIFSFIFSSNKSKTIPPEKIDIKDNSIEDISTENIEKETTEKTVTDTKKTGADNISENNTENSNKEVNTEQK